MTREPLDFKSEKPFPFHFQLFGYPVFVFRPGVHIGYSFFLAPVLLMAGLFILTGYQGVEFNCFHKAYWEYNSFVFLKFGKYKKYKKVEKLFISTSATRQKIYTRVTEGTTVKREEFNASLKFDDGTKVFLSSKKDKDLLVRQVRRLSNFFQLEISETTN